MNFIYLEINLPQRIMFNTFFDIKIEALPGLQIDRDLVQIILFVVHFCLNLAKKKYSLGLSETEFLDKLKKHTWIYHFFHSLCYNII